MANPRSIAISMVAIVIGMFCLAYASVPLYRMFCQVTGFGGTTQVAKKLPSQVINREITVRFNADVAPNLRWKFGPEQKEIKLKIGENKLAFFKATNLSDQPLTGTATYNVTPEKTGSYFNKIQCFCFERQTIAPGETVEFPVSFFVDPEMVKDRNLEDVDTITLSYTFFKVKEKQDAQATNKGI